MTAARGIVSDLIQRRLWPLAVVLLAAIAAVPVMLSRSPAPAASAPVPTGGLPAALSLPGTPAVSVASERHPRLTAPPHDPFYQGARAKSVSSAVGHASASLGSLTSPGSGSGSAVAAGAGSISSGGATLGSVGGGGIGRGSSGEPVVSPPHRSAPPAPVALHSTQSYMVTVAVTQPDGGLNTLDLSRRLSLLPDPQQPLLVELGVLRGGRRALFAAMPNASVSGQGTCVPGPVDCEVIMLAPNQVENVSGPSGYSAQVAVMGISAVNHGSVAAASAARRAASPAGAGQLRDAGLPALSLFSYQPALGALVDLRNLQGGGG